MGDRLRDPAAPADPPHPSAPLMCSSSSCFFNMLFLCDKCCRRCQITYGKRTRLLLQLLVLQPCMKGMALGVPTKVPDVDIVLPSVGSSMVTCSSSQPPRRLSNKAFRAAFAGSLCLCVEDVGEALWWLRA